MALSIVNNPLSIGAQGSVNGAQGSLSKTIKSLSTGLRINSAADDASGLAVSEKLRSQISGLSKAATNAQDAISMLQTAEGAMGSMNSMVQRIRELAVQAGDPAYTANDRAMLQLEVDQLKEEIDRVSTSTEFNTKKLLNGDAAALWTSSTDNIEAIVNGAAVEGNYKITYDVEPGQNSVYKSNIMRLGEGEMSYDINANGTSITKLDNINGMMRTGDGDLDIKVESVAISAIKTSAVNTDVVYGKDKSITAGSTDMAFYFQSGNGVAKYDVSVTSTSATFNGLTFTTSSTTATTRINGVEYTVTFDPANSTLSLSGGTVYTKKTAGATMANDDLIVVGKKTSSRTLEYTGNNKDVLNHANDGLDSIKQGGSSYVEFEVLSDFQGATGQQSFQIRVRTRDASTGKLSDWVEMTINTSGKTVGENALFKDKTQLFTAANMTEESFKKGDKILASVSNDNVVTVGQLKEDQKANAKYGKVTVSSSGATVLVRDITNVETDKKHTFYTAQMDKSGKVYYGNLDMTFSKGAVVSGTMSVDILGAGDVASEYTKLSQLAQFTNSDGRMVLANTQEISIYAGNGKTAKVTLEGSDSIKDLESKLNAALVEQLGLGADGSNPVSTEVNRNLVKFVQEEGQGDRAVKGTFVIQGAKLGDDSNLTFVGDEAVLNGLGITQIQKASDSALNVRVTDAHTGEFIGEDVVTDGKLRNVIPGVDIEISPESATEISFNEFTNEMIFAAKATSTDAFLHIKDTSTKAAIGANEGQTLDLSIGRLDTKSLEITDVNVATFEDAQRSITQLDMALEKINKARSTAGAQMNRLEYTINNLNTTRENMTAAESRIRDLDIAQASSSLAAEQVLMQSASAMLAQANQMPSYAMQLIG